MKNFSITFVEFLVLLFTIYSLVCGSFGPDFDTENTTNSPRPLTPSSPPMPPPPTTTNRSTIEVNKSRTIPDVGVVATLPPISIKWRLPQGTVNCSNSSLNFSDFSQQQAIFPSAVVVFLVTTNASISIATCVLNFLILVTFLRTPTLRSPSNILIVNLALADFGTGAVVQPLFCMQLYNSPGSESIVDPRSIHLMILRMLILYSSLLTLTAITIDRYLSIRLHLRYNELVTSKKAYATILSIGIVSLGLAVFFSLVEVHVIDITLFSFLFLINVVLMVIISLAINKLSAKTQQLQSSFNLPKYKKTVNTMFIITGLFLLCYTPGHVFKLTTQFLEIEDRLRILVKNVASTFWLANSALNPIIYFWRIERMRSSVATMCGCQKKGYYI